MKTLREHGTRTKYMHDGCRCFQCRLANADYETARMRARRAGAVWQARFAPERRWWVVRNAVTGEIVMRTADRDQARGERDRRNRECRRPVTPFASAREITQARRHLQRLLEAGIGLHAIANACGVKRDRLREITDGKGRRPDRPLRLRVRQTTVERILQVWPNPGDGAVIDAGETWRILRELIAAGYPKAHIAHALGCKMPALQIRKDRVLLRTERAVKALHDATWPHSTALRAVCRCPEWQPERKAA